MKKTKFKPSKKVIVLACVAGVLLVLLVGMLVILSQQEETSVDVPTTETTEPTTQPTSETTEPTTGESTETEPAETEPVMLEHMAELYAQNPDIVGWITIPDTKLDYPVMYTPNESMKYLYRNFEGNFTATGLPFVDNLCSLDPESDNLIIHGHNMQGSGGGFAAITNYVDQDYYDKHPLIYVTTLYEERTYEIVAAFYDRIYDADEEGFVYHRFVNAYTEEDFIEAAAYYRARSEIDTGIELEYGDQLITLATCSYHVQDGRFVVIARLVTEEEPAA